MVKAHSLKIFGEEDAHKVLFLPAYHPEYNSIELAWSQVKGFVGRIRLQYGNSFERNLPMTFAESFKPDRALHTVRRTLKDMTIDAEAELDPLEIVLGYKSMKMT